MRPRVKSEFISGFPHSVSVAQNSPQAVLDQRADGEVLEIEPAAWVAIRLGGHGVSPFKNESRPIITGPKP
jgi:hypothetical protein